MSSEADAKTEAGLDEEQVRDHLKDNPDFLVRHADLVERLEVPHGGGGTSLLEHQVSVLRDKNRQLNRRMQDYHEAAEHNAQLLEKIHRLYRSMLAADDREELIAMVDRALREEFDCDEVAIGLFADQAPEGALALSGPTVEKEFSTLRDHPEPACGRLNKAKLKLLFPDSDEAVRSVAMTPLDETADQGLLALGSLDEHRYQPGMGTLFIQMLGRMLGETLNHLNGGTDADT